MPLPETISDYLRAHAQELGDRILESHPPLHAIDDPPSPMIGKLLREPYLRCPPYREEVVSVEMDQPLQKAYEDLEQDIKKALREHRGNQSVASVALNALLAYPDRPFGFGELIGREFNPETQRREPFLIAATRDLDEDFACAKERRLVEEIKASLERGRKVQVYAVYTQKRDVTRRLERIGLRRSLSPTARPEALAL